MRIFTDLAAISEGEVRGGCVTVGNFDGVHRGHRALLGRTIELARESQGTACAVTFWPHPRSVVSSSTPLLISTPEQRQRWIEELGVDVLVVQRFDREFAATPPDVFLGELRRRLDARHLVLGQDFHFGRGGRGSVDMARELSGQLGFVVDEFEPVYLNESVVSSSHVRDALAAGDVRKAREYLGRPWQIWGNAVSGAGRGRTLGFPTINFATKNDLLVPDGVYGGRLRLADGTSWVAAVSVGTNPTFGEEPRHVEAFLLDCEAPDVAGDLRLEFMLYVRSQVTYSHAAKLIEQIDADVAVVRDHAQRERWLEPVGAARV